jgi:nucleotide-binding universal stress UspA family protein
MKILLAVDGSPFTKRMLAWLGANDWFKAGHTFTVFHGVPALPHRAASMAGPDLVHGYYEDDAQAVFHPIRAFLAEHQVEAAYVHPIGHPGEMLAKTADEGKFDLVVMGSHGHGVLANLVLGSVTTQVLARCKTPVLVIR